MKRKLCLALAAVSLAIIGGAGIVLAGDGNMSFGIRPTKADHGRPETFSYFSYQLVAPGAVMSDEALVMNSGDVPVTLKLFAADGITAINGGTSFAGQGQKISGVAGWLSLAVTEISLEPGKDVVVPFTISVPADASPGHHVAGLVVEASAQRRRRGTVLGERDTAGRSGCGDRCVRPPCRWAGGHQRQPQAAGRRGGDLRNWRAQYRQHLHKSPGLTFNR